MRARDPHDQPLRVSTIDNEIVFLGEGPISFSMTPAAALATFRNLAGALRRNAGLNGSLKINPDAGRVLLVEDEALVRDLAATLLQDAGYKVVEATTAGQALAILEAGAVIDLMFTDVHMPGDLNGLQLAHMATTRWPELLVLVASGRPLPAGNPLPPGGRFLPKPYLAAELLGCVGQLLNA